MVPEGFIIHLERAVQRRAAVDAIIVAAPVRTEIFAAVDGQRLTDTDLAQVYSRDALMDPTYPFTIGRGEIACFLSHRAIWKRMVEQGIGQALILEDDVALGSGFTAALDLASRFAGVDGFVQFQTRPVKGVVLIEAEEDGLKLIQPQIVPRRTSAQLVGIGAAQRLLAVTERFDRPIDGLLQLRWITGQPIHCVEPSGVRDLTAEVGGTTAQTWRAEAALARLRRAWQRAAYRTAVARGSRRDW